MVQAEGAASNERHSDNAKLLSMAVRIRHEAMVTKLGVVLVVWIALALACAVLVECGLGHYVELFNGATWPGDFSNPPWKEISSPTARDMQSDVGGNRGAWFFVLLSARTFINLGVVLSAAIAIYLFLTGGVAMIVDRIQVFKSERDFAFAMIILKKLEDKGVVLDKDDRKDLLEFARGFCKTKTSLDFESLQFDDD